jgi:hypothetical protein
MTERDFGAIDERLRATAGAVPIPDSALFAAALADRLRSEPRPGAAATAARSAWLIRRNRRRRVGVAVLGVAMACVVAAAAVAPVRSAVADFFGVDGVHITRAAHNPALAVPSTAPPVVTTPPVDPVVALHLGTATTLVGAARLVGFPMRLPTVGSYQRPDVVLVGTPPVGGMASMVYLPAPGRPAVAGSGGVAALLSEFRGHLEAGYFQKVAGPGTTVDPVRVGSAQGFWLSGAPHEFLYVNAAGTVDTQTIRLATSTLVWSAGGITYRLESALPRDSAVAVAASMR